MGDRMHRLILIRHGETEWSRTGRHTGSTDIDLTDEGVAQARSLAGPVGELALVRPRVFTSPRVRARRTAELAGLTVDAVDERLCEWDYGRYEGVTSRQIHSDDPGWNVFTHGAPDGESPQQMSARVDAVIATVRSLMTEGDVVLVSHGHFSRAVLARWTDSPITFGQHFAMLPASMAVLGMDRGTSQVMTLGRTGYASDSYVDGPAQV
ncbi:acid phosphatase [Williamsia sp. CHRR-6]|uniref:acid phosphatase n=1 Tax=Williamsia sp. CHRR-6 TaxID=2835871 RepID=UPI001BDA9222|nr:acid phosphatase [Williamsia sp. CHRR-6]MBT0565662.1 acid phosphatase [Williamsia sp. CHRR-6]